jgi:GTP-binding protein Era
MKSGFVCIVGRPNAGKSTLLNALVGEKLAIVTHKPQTTRTRVTGILNVPKAKGRDAAQVVLVDTPGIHRSETSLDKKMMQEIREGIAGSDLVLLLVDVARKPQADDRFVLDLVRKADTPVFALLNKVDLVEKEKLLPILGEFGALNLFREIIPISARKKSGLKIVVDKVVAALHKGQPYFPADQVTDQPVRFLAAEAIREQVLIGTSEEVPYATTVIIEQWEEEPRLTRISAIIYCERDGQKAILIGRGGQMLKKIGTEARKDIERMLDSKVFLELFVKVRPGWREQRDFLEETDWRHQLETMARAQAREKAH